MEKTVGEKIALARKYANPAITQVELASGIGVSHGYIGTLESGRQNVPRFRVEAIARFLGVPVDWFYDGRDTPPPKTLTASEAGAVYGSVEFTRPEERGLNQNFGRSIALPVWQGVLAGSDGECGFQGAEPGEALETMYLLLGSSDPAACFLIRAAGSSMSPRLEHSEIALVRRNPNPALNTLVVATRPDGVHFVKALASGRPPIPYRLLPLNPAYEPIENVAGWVFQGELLAIMGNEPGQRNIEWNAGHPLRA